VILPEHIHFIIDPLSFDVSNIIQRIKMSFAANYRKRNDLKAGRIWQNRFWDHIIRNQQDMNRHIDYIHYNPVKHGLVESPFSWKESSIHEYGIKGYYSSDWGQREDLVIEGDFGE
ncbi:MAG: REP-associated tyrosine transposase, partial [Candidatus Zixiibacteriota bacterium]